MIIEVIIFVLFIIINVKIMNFKIAFLIASLITFKDKKNLTFMFNDLHFRLFISIIKKSHEVFIIIIITKCNEITDIEMN